MHAPFQTAIPKRQVTPSMMPALVFLGPNKMGIEQVFHPAIWPL